MTHSRTHGSIRLGIAIAVLVIVAFQLVAYLARIPVRIEELVLFAAALATVWLLAIQSCFLSATTLLVSSVPYFAAVLISTDYWGTVSFSVDFPEYVFAEPTKSMAIHAYGISLSVAMLMFLLLAPDNWLWNRASVPERQFGRDHCILFLIGALIVAILNVRGPMITQTAYHSEDWSGSFNAGFDGLWTMLSIAGLCCALRGYGKGDVRFRLTIVLVLSYVVYFRLLRGERSTAFSMILFLAILYYKISPSRFVLIRIVTFSTAGVLFLLGWASVRQNASGSGLVGSIGTAFESTSESLDGKSVMKFDRAPKLTWDLFETAFLYETGERRNGETYLNLIPQSLPSFIAEAIGYERPAAEPWKLAEYFKHGGGIFVFAEAYWNFGLAGSIGFGVCWSLGWIQLERLFRRLPLVLIYGYFGILLISSQTMYVGIQSVVRGIEISLSLTLVGVLLFNPHLRKSSQDNYAVRARIG